MNVRAQFDNARPEPTSGTAALRLPGPPRCAACQDVVGVYEPVIHLLDGRPAETSRAAGHRAGDPVAGPMWHRDCWPG